MNAEIERIPDATSAAQTMAESEHALERARALRSAREFDAADGVLKGLVNTEQPSEAALVEYASVANDRGDWRAAVDRWQSVIDRFQKNLIAHAALVHSLIAALRFDEAEACAIELLRLYPDNARARWAAAWCAHERGVWDLAAARWQAVLDVDQEDVAAVCCHITALTNDTRSKEAEAAAELALRRFGENAQLAETHAWIAHKSNNWPLAVVRWRRVIALDPNHGAAFACLATALRALNRHETAERALLRAIEIAPDQLYFRMDYAQAAEQRGDSAEAQRRWQALRERYAGDQDALSHIGHHELRSGLNAMEAVVPAAASVPADGGERSLLMSMESLGDNCEFGMLQRRFGAEPLGLLRFAGISLSNLIDAMSAGFEGVGDPGRMLIEVLSNGEYLIHDAYGIAQHTFVYSHELPRERFEQQTARRSAFLRNKLLEDLRRGGKLFVYRINIITTAQARELHAAMCNYGRPHLLCVQLSNLSNAPGTVEQVQEGLLFGYVSRFATELGLKDCEYAEWMEVCRAASALRGEWRDTSSQVAPPLSAQTLIGPLVR